MTVRLLALNVPLFVKSLPPFAPSDNVNAPPPFKIAPLLMVTELMFAVLTSMATELPPVVAITTSAFNPGACPPDQVVVALQLPPVAVLVNVPPCCKPSWKSPNAVSPVACVLVDVFVPTVGYDHEPL